MDVKQGYKKTEIGILPNDWQVEKFDEIADKDVRWSITGGPFGSNLKTLDYTPDGIRIIQLQNIGDGVFNNDYKIYTSKSKADQLLSCNIYPNDIILSKMGDPVARACFVPSEDVRYLMASDGIRLVVDKKKYKRKFVHDYLNSRYFRDRAISASTGSTRQRIGLQDLKKLKVTCPPLEEQTAIAQVLSDTDELISFLEKLIEKKKLIKQGTMQQLLTGKKRLSGLSGKWEEVSLGSLAKTFTKQTGFDYSAYIKPKLISSYEDGAIPFIQNKDFNGMKINFHTDYFLPEKVAANFPKILLDERCLLISISGSIGNVGLFSNSNKAFLGGAIAVIKLKENSHLEWLMYYMMSDVGQNKLFGNVKAGSHQNLILDDIRKITIPLPHSEEQSVIIDFLSDIDSEIDSLDQKLNKYKYIKQAMMQNLLTGKIRLV